MGVLNIAVHVALFCLPFDLCLRSRNMNFVDKPIISKAQIHELILLKLRRVLTHLPYIKERKVLLYPTSSRSVILLRR